MDYEPMPECEMEIGETGNHYGGVGITKQDGRFFWGVGGDTTILSI